jgi:hypothetical protein
MPGRRHDGTGAPASSAPMAALAKGRVSRILAWAAALAAGWIGLIQLWAPTITQPQNQFVGNVTEAERFIYSDQPLSAIVAGSSMVESIDLLTNGRLQVLGMNGMSAREALIILLRSGRIPRQVAVELNGLTAPPNDAFVERVFNPIWMPLRQRVLALRTEYQPASVIMSLAKGTFGRGAARGDMAAKGGGAVADIRLAQLRDLYQQPPAMGPLRASLVSVRDSVAALERAGANVIYFEYPVPATLAETPFHAARRAASVEILGQKAASAVRFTDKAFATKDGIHLDQRGQEAVARELEVLLLGPSAAGVVQK